MAKIANSEEKATDTKMKVPEGEKEKGPDKKKDSWVVKIKNNSDFCGIGAGGVQFANGEAVVSSRRMANWFSEHEGYEVITQ